MHKKSTIIYNYALNWTLCINNNTTIVLVCAFNIKNNGYAEFLYIRYTFILHIYTLQGDKWAFPAPKNGAHILLLCYPQNYCCANQRKRF